MATKVTNLQVLKPAKNNNNNKSLSELLLNLKVSPSNPIVTKKIRLIGEPIKYYEVNSKIVTYENELDEDGEIVLNDKGKPKRVKIETEKPFIDADRSKNPYTRIGHDDPTKCPWRAMGYQPSDKYAQNCIEFGEDNTWEIKILNKGNSIFKKFAEHQQNKAMEKHEEGDDSVIPFLGGLSAPYVVIKAEFKPNAPGKVEYSVDIRSKQHTLTEEQISALKALHCPPDEEMKLRENAYKENVKIELENLNYTAYPKFESFFEYGHNLENIFKFTPPIVDPNVESVSIDDATAHGDDPFEKPSVKKSTAKVAPAEKQSQEKPVSEKTAKSESAVFSNVEDDDDWDI